jgi:uncharacterized coiled-coil protein SlyX
MIISDKSIEEAADLEIGEGWLYPDSVKRGFHLGAKWAQEKLLAGAGESYGKWAQDYFGYVPPRLKAGTMTRAVEDAFIAAKLSAFRDVKFTNDTIAEKDREIEELKVFLAQQSSAVDSLTEKVDDLEQKLAKAVEALEKYGDRTCFNWQVSEALKEVKGGKV